MNRVVIDTNILVSSALGGALETILDKWADGAFTLIVTSDILAEYLMVLQRPKFKLKQETLDRITRYLYQFAEFVVPQESFQVIEADPTDNKFLGAAVAAQADAVVSGDRHLLDLQEFRAIRIITAREFIDELKNA
jgi:putative PIN family toxin of toxin-antitoxin system